MLLHTIMEPLLQESCIALAHRVEQLNSIKSSFPPTQTWIVDELLARVTALIDFYTSLLGHEPQNQVAEQQIRALNSMAHELVQQAVDAVGGIHSTGLVQ